MAKEVCVYWKGYGNALPSVLASCLESGTFTDCILTAEGQPIRAHKLILSACSPFFKLLFIQENDKFPIVVLKDVKYTILKAVLNFVYCGEVKVGENEVENFLDVAKSLQIGDVTIQTPLNVLNKNETYTPCRRNNAHKYCGVFPEETLTQISSEGKFRSRIDSCDFHVLPQIKHTNTLSVSSVVTIDTSFGTKLPCNLVTSEERCNRSNMDNGEFCDGTRNIAADASTGPKVTSELYDLIENNQESGATSLPEIVLEGTTAETSQTKDVDGPREEIDGSRSQQPDASEEQNPVVVEGCGTREAKVRRPHVCSECGKAFPSRSHLEVHSRTHSRARPFMCDTCGRVFVQASSLRAHGRLHTGERPFACAACGRRFAYSSHLRRHRLRAHPPPAPPP